MIQIINDTIRINGRVYGSQFSLDDRELLQDIFSNYYTNQRVIIKATDGENLTLLGVVDFFIHLCDAYNIPYDKIYFETQSNIIDSRFNTSKRQLSMFWNTNHYDTSATFLPENNAAFVGCTIGRFSTARLRMLYELEKAFTNDTYLIHHFDINQVINFYKNTDNLYESEINWLKTHTFNIDLTLKSNNVTGMNGWENSIKHYGAIAPNFYIEVVPETHAYNSWWFTEKLGKCLFTGKPFLLAAGQHSLQRIRDMGFKTFNSIIDESYDNESTPALRTRSIINSLQALYTSPNKQALINEMYTIGQHNKSNFKSLMKKQYNA